MVGKGPLLTNDSVVNLQARLKKGGIKKKMDFGTVGNVIKKEDLRLYLDWI